jgi:hypothetical protein
VGAAALLTVALSGAIANGPPEGGHYVPHVQARDLPRGQIIDAVACAGDPAQSYALYLSSTYSPERAWSLLVAFHPAARGRAMVDTYDRRVLAGCAMRCRGARARPTRLPTRPSAVGRGACCGRSRWGRPIVCRIWSI